jgi:hypothetical protein
MVPNGSDFPGTDNMISPSAQAGKFVISLCTVAVPITIPQPRSPELLRYQFFLHTCWEEGTRRHRLYMGYFAARADAQKWLGTLRRIYPSAFISVAPAAEMLTNSQIVSLLDQPASFSSPARNASFGSAAEVPRTAEPRPVRQEPRPSGPSLQDTIEALKVSTLDVNTQEEDPLTATGVRHLRIEIQKEAPSVRPVRRSSSRK